MKKHVLVLSAYDALSHQHWRKVVSKLLPQFRWTQLALPARHFSWRVRGNSLSWGFDASATLEKRYDLLIATSMVDLASLRGFIPSLAEIPTVVYFHENQFAYPANPRQSRPDKIDNLDAAMVSLYTALCADQLVFNSQYNRQTFLAGVASLLHKLPDHVPAGIEDRLARSTVIPVPVGLDLPQPDASIERDPQVLNLAWNHRWEYDKGIDLLLQVVKTVQKRGLAVRFHISGQQFRQQPEEFGLIRQVLSQLEDSDPRLHYRLGYLADRSEYLAELSSCDVVLSTARHDFQGLAVIEACALGCTPLCPNGLVYPEYLDGQFLYTPPGEVATLENAAEIVDQLDTWLSLKQAGRALPKFNPQQFSPAILKECYLALFENFLND
jgi:glycosyltransferase involved in cell wall biosynthesis